MRKNGLVKKSMADGFARYLMCPACNGYYDDCAAYRSADYRQPLLADNAETAHQAHSCGHKKEADVMNQKVGKLLYHVQLHDATLERKRKQQHAYDTRWHTRAREPFHQFSERQK